MLEIVTGFQVEPGWYWKNISLRTGTESKTILSKKTMQTGIFQD
jgi:hypothetical protein